MANLPESASFDAGIYQIETIDAVIGGVDGISNLQAKGLANRTTWLKQQVDALNALKGKGIQAHSPGSSYAGGDQVIYQKNIWQANTAITPGAFNPANWTRQLGTSAEGELSSTLPVVAGVAAIGTSTAVARADHKHPTDTTRAALASPTFTGTPAAPTAAPGTNTTQLATTAFVAALGALKVSKAGDTMTGQLVLQRNGTLDDLNTCAMQIQAANDAIIWFHRPGLFSVALGVDATNNLVYGGGGSTLGAVHQVFHDGNCPKTLAAAGYQKLASGLIVQWGPTGATTGGTVSPIFPITFPNGVFQVVVSSIASNTTVPPMNVGALTTSGATFYLSGSTASSIGGRYMAIGY